MNLNVFFILPLLFISLVCAVRLFYLVRNRFNSIDIIAGSLEILSSGNYSYRTGLKENDLFSRLSQSVDQLAEILEENEKNKQQLEMDQEVFVDHMRDTQAIEERFHRLFENPNFGIFICDFNGQIMEVNDTGCKLLEYGRDEILSMSFYDLYEPAELNRSIDATKIGSEKQAIRFESRFLSKSGRLIHVEISSNIYDIKNEITQNIVFDISLRKQYETGLKESEEKFRSFMESANELMFITDATDHFIYANRAMIRALGFSLDLLNEKTPSDLSVPEAEPKEETGPENNQNVQMEEVVWKTRSGQKIYGELMTSVIHGETGEYLGLRGIFRDVTERKKIAENRRLAQLGRLMADVAHEVKNRLNAIMSIAEFIHLEFSDNSEIAEDMLMIHEECRYMDDFVRQMLNFSKPSEGVYQKTNIHHVLDAVLKLISKSFKRNQIQVQKSFDPKLAEVYIDEKQMSEVFMNLIQNAQEAMEKGGLLEIMTSGQNDSIQVDIRDHGAGIPEEVLARIYDPFFTTKEKGTGLGVSACYGIVKAHGGELRYTSEVGKGTTAHVILPLTPPAPSEKEESNEA